MRPLRSAVLSVLTGLLLTLNLYAQLDRGEISGFVRDPSDAPIVGATVIIRDQNTGLEMRIRSNETGYYQAPNLVSGLYTVEVEAPGFKKYAERDVKLDAASTAAVNVALVVGT